MKRSYRGVIHLSLVLLLGIVFTRQFVNAFFYERYARTIVFASLNLLLVPAT
ncbi:hypothetical protein FHS18_003029 [Paenibacillus phyllosphaerae]|uniref:Uncharacterized protein n=1 Tax=Paenibacillus phyllosphaerae TaxID=274593 RepID=A0A7W5AZL1_9BACL|nr:hypothetical protein [Paenibacillus phyllosphaerae]MBB3110961.1 hypothetical protein [Paenibacillus phyllosphaerae]